MTHCHMLAAAAAWVTNGHIDKMSRDMWFPTMWYFGNSRLSRAYVAFF